MSSRATKITPEALDPGLQAGLLMVGLERALPKADTLARIALAAAILEIRRENVRYWRLSLRDIRSEGRPLGDWQIRLRFFPAPLRRPSLERISWLRGEGDYILAACRALSASGERCSDPAAIALACLASRSSGSQRPVLLDDGTGFRIMITFGETRFSRLKRRCRSFGRALLRRHGATC